MLDLAQLEVLFDGWGKLRLREYRLDRFEKPKMLWEAAVRKKDNQEDE